MWLGIVPVQSFFTSINGVGVVGKRGSSEVDHFVDSEQNASFKIQLTFQLANRRPYRLEDQARTLYRWEVIRKSVDEVAVLVRDESMLNSRARPTDQRE